MIRAAWCLPRRDDPRTLQDCHLGDVVRVGEWCISMTTLTLIATSNERRGNLVRGNFGAKQFQHLQ